MALYRHLIIRVVHFDEVLAPSEVVHMIIWCSFFLEYGHSVMAVFGGLARDKLIFAALSQVPREMGLGVLMLPTVALTAIVSVRGDIAGFVA